MDSGGLDRMLYKHKAFIGYDKKEVKAEIARIQHDYMERKTKLLQSIEFSRAKNQVLKDKWNRVKGSPPKNQLREEISENMMSVFLEHTRSIKELVDGLSKGGHKEK